MELAKVREAFRNFENAVSANPATLDQFADDLERWFNTLDDNESRASAKALIKAIKGSADSDYSC